MLFIVMLLFGMCHGQVVQVVEMQAGNPNYDYTEYEHNDHQWEVTYDTVYLIEPDNTHKIDSIFQYFNGKLVELTVQYGTKSNEIKGYDHTGYTTVRYNYRNDTLSGTLYESEMWYDCARVEQYDESGYKAYADKPIPESYRDSTLYYCNDPDRLITKYSYTETRIMDSETGEWLITDSWECYLNSFTLGYHIYYEKDTSFTITLLNDSTVLKREFGYKNKPLDNFGDLILYYEKDKLKEYRDTYYLIVATNREWDGQYELEELYSERYDVK